MLSLKMHYEPPFNMLIKKLDEILNFEKNSITLTELFENFYEIYGEEFKELIWDKNKKDNLHKQLVIVINGRTYRDENFLQTELKDGDDISFLYVYFGG
jgi:molybdopterin converting factor small subunit